MKRILVVTLAVLAWGALVVLLRPGGAPAEPTAKPADKPAAAAKPAPKNPLREEQEVDCLAFYKVRRPKVHDRLLRLRETNLKSYYKALRDSWYVYSRIRNWPENAQEAYLRVGELKVQIYQTCKAYKNAKDEKTRQRKSRQLAAQVAAQFDADQIVRAYRLEQLQKELKRLGEDIARRKKDRDGYIKSSLDKLLKKYKPPEKKPAPTTKPAKTEPKKPAPKAG